MILGGGFWILLALQNPFENYFYAWILFRFPFFKAIWKVHVPRNVQVFSWLLVLGKLLTYDALQRYIAQSSIPKLVCLCTNQSEDLDHVFLHCSFSLKHW